MRASSKEFELTPRNWNVREENERIIAKGKRIIKSGRREKELKMTPGIQG